MRELRLHKELYVRHSEFIKNLIGEDFKYVNFRIFKSLDITQEFQFLFHFQPHAGVLKIHVYGEIISAINFDYDDLHVYDQLELPKSNFFIFYFDPVFVAS